ncbi:DUF3006 domain-containing protein [Agathobaculum sp.]|uniref:DUF3006 domain-containing protein n=1 Tax=Agathobaculum sp. TaxID=2048138 RepID=UPI002A7F2730|nr:DUF3006 domain-containing protein [Agathobaculum sp.]MDY3618606.1 DUF3006 domain-containing protein [Agathobaculum sp.]
MKQTGIVDRFEGGRVVIEIENQMVDFPRDEAPAMLAEGMVVLVENGRILGIDEQETQRMEDDMRRRFERILGKNTDE